MKEDAEKDSSTLAGNLSVQDKGPFPLCHGDFGHNNMVFDDEYNKDSSSANEPAASLNFASDIPNSTLAAHAWKNSVGVQLPRIGTILRQNEDGSFDQGPIPGIGGPFETARRKTQRKIAHLRMNPLLLSTSLLIFRTQLWPPTPGTWAAKVEFGISEAKLREAAGSFADELSFSASSFIKRTAYTRYRTLIERAVLVLAEDSTDPW
jgi:hypothetical protein